VKRAEVSLEREEARVEFEDTKISAAQLAAAIDRIGFQAKVLQVTDGSPGGK
jgi:copper chaperone CopZ